MEISSSPMQDRKKNYTEKKYQELWGCFLEGGIKWTKKWKGFRECDISKVSLSSEVHAWWSYRVDQQN